MTTAKKSKARRRSSAALPGPSQPSTLNSQPDLLAPPPGTKPIDQQWADAAQLRPFTGMDEGKLRHLGRETNPVTGAPWLPKARNSKWPVAQILMGVNAYLRHQAERQDGLPETYASMGDFTARTLHPREQIEYALKNGCQCRDAANRIYLTPFLEFFAPIYKKIFSGGGVQIKGLEGFEELDSDLQLARLRKEQADALVDEKNIREGRLVDMASVEELLWEKRDAPLRADLLAFSKTFAQQCNPLDPALAQKVIDSGIAMILKKLRDKAPPRKIPTDRDHAA
jgi:hypothetical protein